MNIWLADTASFESAYGFGARRWLISYAYVSPGNAADRWISGGSSGRSIFLDSGAFGVFTGRAQIDLPAYCGYIERNIDGLAHYAALDVIGDWRAGLENYTEMARRGLAPIPTFHKGEPWHVLERVLDLGSDYIALGGMAARGASQALQGLQAFLDRCWEIISRRWPVRVHSFGVTGQDILERYPFYSADSISHAMTAGMGRVFEFSCGRLSAEHWLAYGRDKMDRGVIELASDPDRWRSRRGGRWDKNIAAIGALERYLTDLWALRGISWAA